MTHKANFSYTPSSKRGFLSRGQRIIDHTFHPGFKIKLHRKDSGIALQTGCKLSLALMTTPQVAEMMNALIARGEGNVDHSALAMLVEQMGTEG